MSTRDLSDVSSVELPAGVFSNVLDAYSHRAFQRGYEVAVTEMIGSVLPATEAFLRQNPDTSLETRESLYQFERFLARRFDSVIRSEHWVEGGTGI